MEDFAALNLIGESPEFRETVLSIRRVARFDATTLIEGETGTGKELAAHAIHYLSARQGAPFVPVNCGALQESLLESELYGHERGAFTDAKNAHGGLVLQASGGTLFLDEVETLTPKAQVVLLRFLQDRRYRAVGGKTVRDADVRILAASNTSVEELVRAGSFRADLFYRLNVLKVTIPPLRARRGDIPLLAAGLVRRCCRQHKLRERALSPAAVKALSEYDWPGNVRELENLLLRAVLMSDEDGADPIPLAVPRSANEPSAFAPGSFREAKARAVAEFERRYVADLLARAGGSITRAADLSGKDRSAFGKLARKYGLLESWRARRLVSPAQ